MTSVTLFILISVLSRNLGIEGARILALFPFPSVSHSNVLHSITMELARRGHNVVAFTSDPVKSDVLPNYEQIDLSYLQKTKAEMAMPPMGTADTWSMLRGFMSYSDVLVEALFMNPRMSRMIARNSTEAFDLVITELGLWMGVVSLSYKFSAPLIGVATFRMNPMTYYYVGNPLSIAYIPDCYLGYTNQMNLLERALNLYNNIRVLHMLNENVEVQDLICKKYLGHDTPHIRDIARNMSLVFSYSDPILYYPQANVPAIIEVAGIHLQRKTESVPLPETLQSFLDGAENGFIYFSLGSTVTGSAMSQRAREQFKQAFAELPYRVLWKWENETLVGKPENVYISKWLPQRQILAHPNIRVFMYQGGIQSSEEAIRYAVPVIGIPMFADQIMNVKRMQSAGVGKTIETKLDLVTKDEVKAAILEIITDKTYKDRMIKLQELKNDKPQDVLDKAIWWTEYVIRHKGAAHLKVQAVNMTWYQFTNLDIAAVLIVILLVACFLIYRAIKYAVLVFFEVDSKKMADCKLKSN